jgi:hypothetical protein
MAGHLEMPIYSALCERRRLRFAARTSHAPKNRTNGAFGGFAERQIIS